jgi:hypothetical protein
VLLLLLAALGGLEELEREREWVAQRGERALRDEERDRMDWRTAQQLKDEMKARVIA